MSPLPNEADNREHLTAATNIFVHSQRLSWNKCRLLVNTTGRALPEQTPDYAYSFRQPGMTFGTRDEQVSTTPHCL